MGIITETDPHVARRREQHDAEAPPPRASDGQRQAIEAGIGPLLVLAGPGAGKTFCLIERIRFLIDGLGFSPDRVCAFTFTNKAAGEIAERLERTLGERAAHVKTGTIHAFCAELLREFGDRIGLARGFGIADEDHQRRVLWRIGVPKQLHGVLLKCLAAHRFRGERLDRRDAAVVEKYQRFLDERNVLDFDMLLLETAKLLRDEPTLARVRARWDCVLVDEFQDLNPIQYEIIREIAREHRNVFAVGDDEQSIYSWAGADPRVFISYLNDFALQRRVRLRENHRCPAQVTTLARRLVDINTPIFDDKHELPTGRQSPYEVVALGFPTEDAEVAWVIRDLRREQARHGLHWGDFALLYRKHQIGNAAEGALLAAGLPCRLAHGRALGDDPTVEYVIAALRVIASPDDMYQEAFLEVVLPQPLIDTARAQAEKNGRALLEQLDWMAWELTKEHGDARKIRRGFYALRNLPALGVRHKTLEPLVEELLSHRVGEYRTPLEEHHDALSDPLGHDESARLSARICAAIERAQSVWIPRLGGLEIALQGILIEAGVPKVRLGGSPAAGCETIGPADAPSLGLALGVFKAAQLACSRKFTHRLRDFTAIDVETTDRDVSRSEIVELAAVRVRDGRIVDEFRSLVRPRVPIAGGASRVHGISAGDVAEAPSFEEVWPRFHAFWRGDVLVAHNGYQFDFPILCRMAHGLPGGADICTYDTLPLARDLCAGSCTLGDLARRFGVEAPESHRALADARTLAQVVLRLEDAKLARARKTALVNALDWLGVALALSDDDGLDAEITLLRDLCRPYSLGRYSECLEVYRAERERAEDESIPTVGELIERLGGDRVMRRIQAEKTADQRYPVAMARLRRLIAQWTDGSLHDQMARFLERVALSRSDGIDPERQRVNLLTLHSTKGLEFSRVYILGVEDAELPGSVGKAPTKAEIEEARRLLYVGMTRAKDRLVLTRVEARGGRPTGGHRFLDEIGLVPRVVT
jgi:superfamily I DNA/RNA helicase/DNA polymerase III epsilon subunit-like protein